MTTLAAILLLILFTAALVRYARADHFAGPANATRGHDDLGSLAQRDHLVPHA